MTKRKGQQGFTIVEVMIATLVLGLVLMAWMSLESFTAQTIRRVSDFSAGQKVFLTIMTDILSAERGLPALDPTADFLSTTMTRDQMKVAFQKVTNRKELCYDRNAVIIELTAVSCYYKVSYFKFRVPDNAFPGSDVRNIPLARVVARISYKDVNDNDNKDANPDNDVIKTRFLTRLVSNVADF